MSPDQYLFIKQHTGLFPENNPGTKDDIIVYASKIMMIRLVFFIKKI